MIHHPTSTDTSSDPKSSRKARGLRLASIRQSLRLSRAAFADKLGISAYTLQNWEINKNNGLSEDRAREVVNFLKQLGVRCTFEWLMYGVEPAPSVVDPLAALSVRESLDDILKPHLDNNELERITKELKVFRENYPDFATVEIIVEDDGMAPNYELGEYVAGIKVSPKQEDQFIGQDCIVQTKQGDVLLRHVKKGNLPGHFTLTCLNTNTSVIKPHLYDVELMMVAPILWTRRKYSGII